MKSSGIKWVGKIPENWSVHPLYCQYGERKNKNSLLKETNLLSLSYGNIIRKDINTNGGLLPDNFSAYNIVESDDIIIRPTDLQNDKRSLRTGFVNERGIITSAYIDLKPYSNICSKYYHYLLHSYDIEKVFYNMGNGVRQGLNYSEFSKLLVLEPPLIEQERVSAFLDEKCAQIDDLINVFNNQIKGLSEYKKSIIYETVTKGLSKKAKTKSSNLNWIEQIPDDWGVDRIKYRFNNSKGLPITKDDLIDSGLPVISYGQIHSKLNSGVDISDDLLRFVDDRFRSLYPNCEIKKYDFVFADTSEDYDGCGNCVYKKRLWHNFN